MAAWFAKRRSILASEPFGGFRNGFRTAAASLCLPVYAGTGCSQHGFSAGSGSREWCKVVGRMSAWAVLTLPGRKNLLEKAGFR